MAGLADTTAIITGASRGIGAATARHFSAQGAHVVLAARSGDAIAALANEIEADGGQATALACDVSQYDDMQALVVLALEKTGRLDLLVNNAGLIDPIARLEDSDPAAWATVMDVNVTGVYNAARAALPAMKRNGGGTIVNISSGAATSALEGWSHYCASKAAVLMLTRCIHKEEAANGIRVVGLSPGTVSTEMQVQIKASGINPVSQLDPSVHIPPEWVAEAIAWLVEGSADATAFDGGDFSLKTDEGRALVGLPTV